MNGLLICVASTAAPSGFATVIDPPDPLDAFDPLLEHPVRAIALMATTAEPAIKNFLSLIASPS
ncbi:hypothetical protein GCM10009543_31890 [Leifsonia naganoensis]